VRSNAKARRFPEESRWLAVAALSVALAANGSAFASSTASPPTITPTRVQRELVRMADRIATFLTSGPARQQVLELTGISPQGSRPPAAAPSRIAQELSNVEGLATSARLSDAVRKLDELPRAVKNGLSNVLSNEIQIASTSKKLFEPDAPFHGASARAQRAITLSSISELQQAVLASPPLPNIDLPPLIAFHPTTSSDVYVDSYVVSIDFGGDDSYLNNAGGNNLDPLHCTGLYVAAALLVDFSGNDTYGSTAFCGHGLNGGGYTGAGMLVDQQGDDRYIAGDMGVNGGGAIGAGFLIDDAGNDIYEARDFGTNGGAQAGEGLLLDSGGNDTYRAGSFGTNGGAAFGGAAWLVDLSGDDSYTGSAGNVPAELFASNGGALSGTAHLVDVAGDDTYAGGNGGAQLGRGLLLDMAGDDRYRGINGTTVNGGIGSLVDLTGNDEYVGGNGFADNGVGLLFDGEGTDTYTDNWGATVHDCSEIPRGTVGAQIDSPRTTSC
jgi:hypothetical protein